MKQHAKPEKGALAREDDRETIGELTRNVIDLRRRMLRLGEEHAIRLHYGAMFSCAEILVTLYSYWMTHDPCDPQWAARDRFVLSKGHAAPILYGVLAMHGYFPDSEFDTFRKLGSRLQGHPDRNKTPGVDCTTGSLGQGMPVACGMALARRRLGSDYHVYSLVSDGECNEGSVWEAALIAANLKIDRLTILLDWNGKSSYGSMTGRNDVSPLREKWIAFGWHVTECDGHDFVSITRALAESNGVTGRPSVILCKTIKNRGIPSNEGVHTRSNYGLEPEKTRESYEWLDAQEEEAENERNSG